MFFFAFDFTVHCICAATKAAGGGDGEARGLQLSIHVSQSLVLYNVHVPTKPLRNVYVVGGVHVDGGGYLHDVLLALGHVAGHLSATLNQAGVLHPVHLDLPLDDGGVVGNGFFEHGGDRDGDRGGGGLRDLGGGT